MLVIGDMQFVMNSTKPSLHNDNSDQQSKSNKTRASKSQKARGHTFSAAPSMMEIKNKNQQNESTISNEGGAHVDAQATLNTQYCTKRGKNQQNESTQSQSDRVTGQATLNTQYGMKKSATVADSEQRDIPRREKRTEWNKQRWLNNCRVEEDTNHNVSRMSGGLEINYAPYQPPRMHRGRVCIRKWSMRKGSGLEMDGPEAYGMMMKAKEEYEIARLNFGSSKAKQGITQLSPEVEGPGRASETPMQ